MKLAHITLMVKDYDKSLYFYERLMGLKIHVEFSDGDGNRIVMLGKDKDTKLELVESKEHSCACKGVSLGFYVKDIDIALRKIQSEYKTEVSELFQPNPFTKFLFITDPDGYTVQLLEEK